MPPSRFGEDSKSFSVPGFKPVPFYGIWGRISNPSPFSPIGCPAGPPRSVGHEHPLDFLRILRLCEGQHQENPGLLGIQVARDDKIYASSFASTDRAMKPLPVRDARTMTTPFPLASRYAVCIRPDMLPLPVPAFTTPETPLATAASRRVRFSPAYP